MLNSENALVGIVTTTNAKVDRHNPKGINVGMVIKISIYEPYINEIMKKMNACN